MPREIRHVVPGSRTTETEMVQSHEEEAKRVIEQEIDTLPDLWETVREESGGKQVEIIELSDLLLGDTSLPEESKMFTIWRRHHVILLVRL